VFRALLVGAAFFASPSVASAQFDPGAFGGRRAAPPCVLDKCLGVKPTPSGGSADPVGPDRSRSGTASGNFDFYVLALSWSPSFCAAGGADKSPDQCTPGANPGFVVHGLWPQNQHGYPEACDASGARFPSRLALDSAKAIYPDERLARHEWRQHGTCSGKSPTDYFADVRRARQSVAIPPELTAPTEDQTWAPLDIARSFAAANPRLRTDEMAVICRRGALEEVRICFSKDLRGFVPCPEIARASCRRAMTVPAG
jgi:ribonuclease T2